jgi:CHAT domain-containing protein
MGVLLKFIVKNSTYIIRLILFLLGLVFAIGILPVFPQVTPPTDPYQLIRQGEELYRSNDLLEAADKFQEAVNIFENLGDKEVKNLAISSINLCRIELELGRNDRALENCQKATNIYEHSQDDRGILRSKIYQASALQNLGFYPKACLLVTNSLGIVVKNCDELTNNFLTETTKNLPQDLDPLLFVSWRILGDILRETGSLDRSKTIFENLTDIASDPNPAATLLSLGNTQTALGNLERDRQAKPQYNYLPWQCKINDPTKFDSKYYRSSLTTYEESARSTDSPTLKIKANLNRLRILLELSEYSQATELAKTIEFDDLPVSQFKVFARINYNKSLVCLNQQYLKDNNFTTNIIGRSIVAVTEAEKIDDRATKSYALGNLGGLYEYLNKQQEAETKTQAALYLSQNLPNLAYQWEWQLGRIFAAKQDKEKAIKNYELAVKDLDISRKDLLQIDSDVQFSFRDNVEPLYRQLIDLLLTTQEPSNKSQQPAKIIYYLESLQLAELSNFLRCNPTDFSLDDRTPISISNISENKIETLSQKLKQVHQNDPNAAVIYPIVLGDRLVTILSLPERELKIYTTAISSDRISEIVSELRRHLESPIDDLKARELNQQLYTAIISPLAKDLTQPKTIKTLVFILDNALQNIPVAALFDGEKYLIEKYAVALIPSLQLLNPESIAREQISVLMAGATDAPSFDRENLSSLPNVRTEIEGTSSQVDSQKQLLDREFIEDNLQQQINTNPFSIVHIATHGKFSSNPEQTYVLDWSQRIRVEDLERLLRSNRGKDRQPIDLLILSACETAYGDRRAALGLAGVALRAGARSTIATLWQVNDASTAELMIQFYRNLQNPQLTKAEALRQAQLWLLNRDNYRNLDYNRAYYWSPFVIVGNWL